MPIIYNLELKNKYFKFFHIISYDYFLKWQKDDISNVKTNNFVIFYKESDEGLAEVIESVLFEDILGKWIRIMKFRISHLVEK